MNPSNAINTLCLGEAPLAAMIDTVADLGARAISPEIGQVRDAGPGPTARWLRDAGLSTATLTHRAFGFADPSLAGKARERLAQTLDTAVDIGAHAITMTTGGRGELAWGNAAARFAEAVAPLAEQARAAGIRLTIEPTSHLYADASIAHRLADCAAIARSAGIAVTLDVFACWFDSDIMAAIGAAGPDIAIVQLSDYVAGDRALPCRAIPGDGMVPLGEIVGAIERTGFEGFYDLEIIGPRLAAEGFEAGLRLAAAATTRLLDLAHVQLSTLTELPHA